MPDRKTIYIFTLFGPNELQRPSWIPIDTTVDDVIHMWYGDIPLTWKTDDPYQYAFEKMSLYGNQVFDYIKLNGSVDLDINDRESWCEVCYAYLYHAIELWVRVPIALLLTDHLDILHD